VTDSSITSACGYNTITIYLSGAIGGEASPQTHFSHSAHGNGIHGISISRLSDIEINISIHKRETCTYVQSRHLFDIQQIISRLEYLLLTNLRDWSDWTASLRLQNS